MFALCYILEMSVETSKHPLLRALPYGTTTSGSICKSWNRQTGQIHMGFTNHSPAKICIYELTSYLHFNQMSLLLKFYKATQQQGERWRDY